MQHEKLKPIAIYGAGGFGREVACLLHQINETKPTWNFIGFFDDSKPVGEGNVYGRILGGMSELNSWPSAISLVVAIGSPQTVKTLVEKIQNPLIDFPNIVAPTTLFLNREMVRLGHGNIICNFCLISCNVEIGDFNLLNGYIPVGHDTRIGHYNVIMPSTNISGGVEIGDCNFFGVHSVVLQYNKVGNNVRVGANSVIMRTAKDGFLYVGNPAIKMKF